MNHQMQQLQSIDVIEHVWIPMPDGIRLAARLWLPADSARQPAPAVFEYIPYRKVDMVRAGMSAIILTLRKTG